jgi:hypothetical protein
MGQVTNKIENKFWEIMIPWLENNAAARSLVRKGYSLQKQLPERGFWVRSLFWVSAGFSLGLGLGTILAIIMI